MVCKILFPRFAVPQFDMVSDSYKGDAVFQAGSFSQIFIQKQPSLCIEFYFAGQGKAYSLEGHSLIRSGHDSDQRVDYAGDTGFSQRPHRGEPNRFALVSPDNRDQYTDHDVARQPGSPGDVNDGLPTGVGALRIERHL